MLGPLLVALAHEFQTSVALVGQLAAATAITRRITAPLAGPVSDAYGRRLMLLTGLLCMAWGILGSVLAWNYSALLVFRLLTGVGASLMPPNGMATIAEVFRLKDRGRRLAGSSVPVGSAWRWGAHWSPAYWGRVGGDSRLPWWGRRCWASGFSSGSGALGVRDRLGRP